MGWFDDSWFWEAVTAAIAVLALFRPEIARWRRRATNQIDILPRRNFEIGFSHRGSTFGCVMALQGRPHHQFVTTLTVLITRKSDDAKLELECDVFRPLHLGAYANQDIYIASGFTLFAEQGQIVNPQFVNDEVTRQITLLCERVRALWEGFKATTDLSTIEGDSEWSELFDRFSTRQDVIDIRRGLDELKYWRGGRFSAEIAIHTSAPEKKFTAIREFEISDAEAIRLSENTLATVAMACGIERSLNFVHAAFRKPQQ